MTSFHINLYLLQELIIGGININGYLIILISIILLLIILFFIKKIRSKKEEVKIADYFVVALKMLELEEKGERIWFSKLVESFKNVPEISKEKVEMSLTTLEDWLLVSSEYGVTYSDHARRLYYLTEEGRGQMIKIRDSIKGRKIKIIEELNSSYFFDQKNLEKSKCFYHII